MTREDNHIADSPRPAPGMRGGGGDPPEAAARMWVAECLCLAALLLAYLASRLHGLLSIPLYIDEAIHVEAARKALSGDWRAGISLGKWFGVQGYGFAMNALGDSLCSIRLVPVATGMATLLLLYALGRSADGTRAIVRALSGAVLYILAPYALFYDKIALTDQFQAALLALVTLLSFRIADKPRLADRVLLGITLAVCPLFKFSGMFFLSVPFLVAVIMTRSSGGEAPCLRGLILPYALAGPAMVAAILFAAPVGESEKMADLFPILEFFRLLGTNSRMGLSLLWTMLTPPFLVALVVGGVAVLVLAKEDVLRRRAMAFAAVAAVPVLPYVLIFRCWYPHYLLPLLVPLCLLGGEVAAFAMDRVWRAGRSGSALLWCALLAAMLVPPAAASIRMALFPWTFPHHEIVRRQYFTGSSSGCGLEEAVGKIRRLADGAPGGIRVLRTSKWDQSSCGLDFYADRLGPGTQRVTLDPWKAASVCVAVRGLLADGKPTYLLFNSACPYPGDRDVIESIRGVFGVQEEAHFPKPGGNPGLRIWRLHKVAAHEGGGRSSAVANLPLHGGAQGAQ